MMNLDLDPSISLQERVQKLKMQPSVLKFLQKHPSVNRWEENKQYLVYCLAVLKQTDRIFPKSIDECSKNHLDKLLADLQKVEDFYQEKGGIIGYHQIFIDLVKNDEPSKKKNFIKPPILDIRNDFEQTVQIGLKSLKHMAFAFPLGGAADRLNLLDPKDRSSLPASLLPFMGTSLLEHLFRDIEALEYMYEKTFSESISIPVVIMTSSEKRNHEIIVEILEKKKWFSRPKESILLIQQISVPVISEDGDWIIPGPCQVLFKPSGHGAIWKLMQEKNAFSWLRSMHKQALLLRQINNPMGGRNANLLALLGYGIEHKKKFGFLSCERIVGSAQGMNVLQEKKEKGFYFYGITNIEYVEFSKYNIEDKPKKKKSPFSEYPANTNLLFADLASIEEALIREAFPGKITNLKHQFETLDEEHNLVKKRAGRVELMMQNIADEILDRSDHPFDPSVSLSTFLLFNDRIQTMSAIKKAYHKGKSIQETAYGCFYELMQNNHELFSRYCHLQLPDMFSIDEYLHNQISFLLYYHPSLGPLYTEIAKKVRKGVLKKYAEMQLTIADLEMENFELDGSLLIEAENMKTSRCILKNVQIHNAGIDFSKKSIFWKNKIFRKEKLHIYLHNHAEFIAEDICFKGQLILAVPEGVRIRAYEKEGQIQFLQEKI